MDCTVVHIRVFRLQYIHYYFNGNELFNKDDQPIHSICNRYSQTKIKRFLDNFTKNATKWVALSWPEGGWWGRHELSYNGVFADPSNSKAS